MILAESFIDLIKDPHHWGFEILAAVAEFVLVGLLLTPLVKRWIRNHDKKVHSHSCGSPPVKSKKSLKL